MTNAVDVRGLTLEYRLQTGWVTALEDVSLSITAGQIHGLVGESGSGKTTLALAIMGYLPANARIAAGEILFGGHDLTKRTVDQLRELWGSEISLVPQDALAALNPSIRIGEQISEVARRQGKPRAEADALAVSMLTQVRIADAEDVARRYPHQLSGGMQQRVVIAMALVSRPRLLVLDEPTTSLDVTTQAAILDLVRDLIRANDTAALYVSHDLGLVSQLCDQVTVVYGGEVMASAPTRALFQRPLHPYTIGLIASRPRFTMDSETRLPTIDGVAPSLAERPRGCVFADRCAAALDRCHAEKPPLETVEPGRTVKCHRWSEIAAGTLVLRQSHESAAVGGEPLPGHVLKANDLVKTFSQGGLLARRSAPVHALNEVSLNIRRRSTLGVVGESGSGKTTLARCIVALETADSGTLELLSIPLSLNLKQRDRSTLRSLQMIFQNPNDSLNPYHTVGHILTRTIQRLDPSAPRPDIQSRMLRLLEAVRLSPEYASRFPNELSGGERQRVGIARAFAADPALVIADEPTSALDVSVQSVVLNLLKDLRASKGVSYLFISHDLRAVAYLADWIIVMYLGQIIEVGNAAQVYLAPSHPYTEALLSALADVGDDVAQELIRLEGDPPSASHIPRGCPFHTRCPRRLGEICETVEPPWRDAGDDHFIRCHIPIDDLIRIQKDVPS